MYAANDGLEQDCHFLQQSRVPNILKPSYFSSETSYNKTVVQTNMRRRKMTVPDLHQIEKKYYDTYHTSYIGFFLLHFIYLFCYMFFILFYILFGSCDCHGVCCSLNETWNMKQALGMSLPYSSSTPADDPMKKEECHKAAKAVHNMLEKASCRSNVVHFDNMLKKVRCYVVVGTVTTSWKMWVVMDIEWRRSLVSCRTSPKGLSFTDSLLNHWKDDSCCRVVKFVVCLLRTQFWRSTAWCSAIYATSVAVNPLAWCWNESVTVVC